MADQILEPEGSHEPTEYAKTPKKAAASGWVGSALEYYDFFIYAQAAALVFPTLFFPSDNPQVGIVASFATFGVGYVARPLGAFILGHWGDKHGRKTVLVLCMMLIGFSTFCVGLLPSYAAIGIWAPILLVVLRLIQGFAVGGEIAGAGSMIMEHSPFGRRGYFSSFTLQGVQAGQILAAAVFLPLAAILPEDAFQSWGWRIPFLLSAVVVLAGIIIRRRVDETPAFKEEEVHGEVPKAPIVMAVKENGADMLRVICMALMNVVPLTATVFGATFATSAGYGVGLTSANYLWISVAGNIVAVILIPFVGNLSDRIGRRPVIIAGCLGAGVLGIPVPVLRQPGEPRDGLHLRHPDVGDRLPGIQRRLPVLLPGTLPDQDAGHGVRHVAEHRHHDHRVPAADLRGARAHRARRLRGGKEVHAGHGPAVGRNLPGGGRTLPDTGGRHLRVHILVVGTFTLVFAAIAALAAFSARETSRIHMNDLGKKDAVPVPKEEYERLRSEAKALSSK